MFKTRPNFILTSLKISNCRQITSTGNFFPFHFDWIKKRISRINNTRILKGYYACIEASIKIQRDLSAYINDIYLPSTFIVGLSFISFHIDHKSAPARAPLGVMSVLSNKKEDFLLNLKWIIFFLDFLSYYNNVRRYFETNLFGKFLAFFIKTFPKIHF